jgi:hypothetical protein
VRRVPCRLVRLAVVLVNWITRRVARKSHFCEWCWDTQGARHIRRGDVYLEHVITPNHDDVGNDNWWRVAECSSCARRSGRAELVEQSP